MKGKRTPEELAAYRLRGRVPDGFVRPAEWPASCENCGKALVGAQWRFCSEHCGKKVWHAENHDKYDAWQLKRQRADPQKWAARILVNDAVKDGRLVRPDICSSCGKVAQYIEGHHHMGYAKPHELDVVWLCKKCHWRVHHPAEPGRVLHVLSDGRAFSHLHREDGSAFYDSRKPGHPETTFRWEPR